MNMGRQKQVTYKAENQWQRQFRFLQDSKSVIESCYEFLVSSKQKHLQHKKPLTLGLMQPLKKKETETYKPTMNGEGKRSHSNCMFHSVRERKREREREKRLPKWLHATPAFDFYRLCSSLPDIRTTFKTDTCPIPLLFNFDLLSV